MKRLRILPGAAGIIALTATIGFIDGQRKIEDENFSKGRITQISTLTHIEGDNALPGNQPDTNSTRSASPAYLVEIKHGDTLTKVLIDAVTGRILLS